MARLLLCVISCCSPNTKPGSLPDIHVTQGSDWTGIAAIAGTVTNLGFAIVVGWYLLTKALPKMHEAFQAELQRQREFWQAREDRREDKDDKKLAAILMHCEKESQRRDETMRAELSIIGKTLEDQSEILERHSGSFVVITDGMKELLMRLPRN